MIIEKVKHKGVMIYKVDKNMSDKKADLLENLERHFKKTTTGGKSMKKRKFLKSKKKSQNKKRKTQKKRPKRSTRKK